MPEPCDVTSTTQQVPGDFEVFQFAWNCQEGPSYFSEVLPVVVISILSDNPVEKVILRQKYHSFLFFI